MPNKSVADAKIKRIKKTEDPNILLANIEILSSKPVEGYADFASRFVGRTVEAKLLAPEIESVTLNRPMKLTIRYEGDEHGGAFFAEKQIHNED